MTSSEWTSHIRGDYLVLQNLDLDQGKQASHVCVIIDNGTSLAIKHKPPPCTMGDADMDHRSDVRVPAGDAALEGASGGIGRSVCFVCPHQQ